jgi:hypothetical protein
VQAFREREIDLIPPILRNGIRATITAESPWPLFVYGPEGVGKTCAGLCLLDWSDGLYDTVSGLCARLIQSQQGRLEWNHEGRGGTLWPEQVWKLIRSARLYVLDELGARERVSDAHYEVVKTAIEEREYKPLVVLSNISLAAIHDLYDARISSRLAAGTVIEISGSDRRLI